MSRKYNVLLILMIIHCERVHRKVFYNYFVQDYETTNIENIIFLYHKLLCWLFPEYRPYLKHYKQVINRAYNQKRLTLINYVIRLKLSKVNTIRYSDYFDLN